MLRVALTVASRPANRTACAAETYGIPTIDADDVVHGRARCTYIDSDHDRGAVWRYVPEPDGSIDRPLLATHVFAHAESRRQLKPSSIPLFTRTIRNWFDMLDSPLGVASIPLLYETRREEDFDVVVVTVCPPDTQVQRLRDRGMSDVEARQRMAAQMRVRISGARRIVIRTDGTMRRPTASGSTPRASQ